MLTPLSHAIIEARGTIDKCIGDAIVAFWNAPLEDKGHAANACSAALEMIERLDAFNEQRRVEAETASIQFEPLRIGIGVNSGNCVVGNVGSDLRFDYSVLGDTVNLCARLDDQSKTYGVRIIVGPKPTTTISRPPQMWHTHQAPTASSESYWQQQREQDTPSTFHKSASDQPVHQCVPSQCHGNCRRRLADTFQALHRAQPT